MILRGHEFDFSALNADDLDRMEAALKHQQAFAASEKARYTREHLNTQGILRSQCRIFMNFIDEVLGEGASELLGLNGSNFNECQKLALEFNKAMEAEKAAVKAELNEALVQAAPAAPQNRDQRRQNMKKKKRKPHGHPKNFAPALQMVERVDAKAARREELLRELKALDND